MYCSIDLEHIELGEAFQSFIITLAVLALLYTSIKKVYSIYIEFHENTNKKESHYDMLERHEVELKVINTKLDTVISTLEHQDARTNESNIVNLKYDLYKIYEKCDSRGYVTQEELKCYIEKEKVYIDSGGNDFIHEKIHHLMFSLPIRK